MSQSETPGTELVRVVPEGAGPCAGLAWWRNRGQRGMTTAEYAVGTVAAVTFVGVLIKVLLDPSVYQLILKLILWVLRQFWGD
ncbi:hypothetical protein GCM10009841_01450 [Microlunatus panaciterrae]|uniref:DUF4244 domain-containing protein n=1 Tax=Microlunatus panaciterrae TaxID=400768 RepID=A0ABS2RKY4_9ACTN|nr:DUF4244 domain-containing protein [Microlunatus panaciterrae]MBM7799227.1 hypothetical protein [Microlunatus panaciterrae]